MLDQDLENGTVLFCTIEIGLAVRNQPSFNLHVFLYIVEDYRVGLFHKFDEMFHQKPSQSFFILVGWRAVFIFLRGLTIDVVVERF